MSIQFFWAEAFLTILFAEFGETLPKSEQFVIIASKLSYARFSHMPMTAESLSEWALIGVSYILSRFFSQSVTCIRECIDTKFIYSYIIYIYMSIHIVKLYQR